MEYTSQYRPFFKIEFYHQYFLDDGLASFASLSPADSARQLANYDWGDILAIRPSPKSAQWLAGNQILLKNTAHGLMGLIKVNSNAINEPYIDLELMEDFQLIISIRDPLFYNYTGLEPAEGMIFLTNKIPSFPAAHSVPTLSRAADAQMITSDYQLSSENAQSLDLTYGQKGLSRAQMLLSLSMQGDQSNLGLINLDGTLKAQMPLFRVHFPNRKTIWKYNHSRDNFISETKVAYPLTSTGYIDLKNPSDFNNPPADFDKYSFPNPTASQIIYRDNKIYSEIFI